MVPAYQVLGGAVEWIPILTTMRTCLNEQSYPFAWLDELIEVTLNPAKMNGRAPAAEEQEQIIQQLTLEARQVFTSLKARTLLRLGRKKITLIAEQYCYTVDELISSAEKNLTAYLPDSLLSQTGRTVLTELLELRAAIGKRYRRYLPASGNDGNPLTAIPELSFKLLFQLSADQLSIFLRAAYEIGVIAERSLSRMFVVITPYLSSREQEVLSAESMRSHSGRAEKNDKDTVIGVLQRIIDQIKGYR